MPTDTFNDVAAILHPMPEPPTHPDPADVDIDVDIDVDGYEAACFEIAGEREDSLEQMRLGWEEGGSDPLLGAIASARRVKEGAEVDIRRLLAYGREFVEPRPYTLADLAKAAGMSISGVRTGYDHHDVDLVAKVTGTKWRASRESG